MGRKKHRAGTEPRRVAAKREKPAKTIVSGRRAWIATFVVAAALAYSSALRAPFVFDDLPAIRRNASIRQLLPLTDLLQPPANTSVSGRPVVNVSLAVNHAVNEMLDVDEGGPNGTLGYHVANVLIHVLCGVLLFGVIRRTLVYWARDGDSIGADECTRIAGFTALLWLLHPIQTEAVDYVIQRTELIVSACYLATLYASIRAWDATPPARRRWYVLGIVACALGMASKEVMASAPIIVLLYDRAFRAGSWKELAHNQSRRRFAGGLVACMIIVVVSIATNARSRSVGFDLGVTWYQYLYTQAWAVARYLRLLVWPSGLTFDYGEAPIHGARGIPGLLLLTACAVATAVAWTRARWMWLGFLGAWFFFILAPSSSFVPIRTEIAAERRIYLASAAVFLLAVLGAHRLWRRAGLGAQWQRVATGAVAVLLAAVTFARGRTYETTESLYRDVIAKAPDNPRGYVGVGMAMFQSREPRFAEAAALFRRAVALDSTTFVAWQSLGLLGVAEGNWPEAVKAYEHALRLQPDNTDALDGMARARVGLGQADAAMPYVNRLGGRDKDVMWSLGRLLVDEGRGKAALPYLELAASEGDPSSLDLAVLSMAYAESDRVDEAVTAAQMATASAADTAGVYEMAGRAMVVAHHITEAEAYLKEAVSLDPSSVSAKNALDSALAIRP